MITKLHQLFQLPESGTPLICLAPMAGFTDGAMRRIASQHSAALTFTEMTSAMGLLYEQSKTWQLLERMEGEAPVMGHLYGSTPESLAGAARMVEERGGFVGIDLNAGCPVKKITKNGAGAALISNPRLIYKILAAMRSSTSLPLTVKTRLGPHPGKVAIFEILQAAQDAGTDAIIVHGRFTAQGHGGDPDLKLLGEVKARATIPVIGNGGIRSAWDGWRMFKETGVDGLMVARSAIGNPWIFEEIRAALAASEPPEIYDPTRGRPRRDLKAIRQVLLDHLDIQRELLMRHLALADCKEGALEIERALAVTFQCHLFRYLSGLKGSSYLRSHLRNLKSMDSIIAAIDGCIERERAFRDRG
ncbi:MAG: tRNA-dihydrouridine synthase family protein [Kiritimatiellae bacterium]|nr:tRNA-dihydrouridine synthase family protein [Kiritimatiellia bacterium]